MQKFKLILKLGGSILSPSEENLFDVAYISKLKAFISKFKETHQFVITVGGGALAKKYQKIARENGSSNRDIDWAGVAANNLNASMLRVMLGELASENVLNYEEVENNSKEDFSETVLVAGANEPGHSGDTDSVIMAMNQNSKIIYNLKNIDGVYSADPNLDSTAKRFDKLTWDEYLKIIKVEEFTPKMSVPIDPIAARMASENGIKFIILDGRDLDNLEKAIKGVGFVGTKIEN